jgi:hypothetical protein
MSEYTFRLEIDVKVKIDPYKILGGDVLAPAFITEIANAPVNKPNSIITNILEQLWNDTDLSDRVEWAKEMGKEK